MSVDRDELQHIVALAMLDLPPDEIAALARDAAAILDYVSQLDQVQSSDAAPDRPAPLRPDVIESADLAIPPGTNAPAFRDGFFLVPRLGAMENR